MFGEVVSWHLCNQCFGRARSTPVNGATANTIDAGKAYLEQKRGGVSLRRPIPIRLSYDYRQEAGT